MALFHFERESNTLTEVNRLIKEAGSVSVRVVSGSDLEKELTEIPDYIDKVGTRISKEELTTAGKTVQSCPYGRCSLPMWWNACPKCF